ncbi:MAG: FecR domain-containing protein [Chitinophagaceae bacterium]|nr:FecR domain-containing protein [Chitinophagaceae bacterium]
MSTHSTSFLQLLTGYLTDELDAEQHDLFMEMLQSPSNQELLEQAIDTLTGERSIRGAGNAILQARSLRSLQEKINGQMDEPVVPVRRINQKWMVAAAIAAIVISFTWLWFNGQKGKNDNPGMAVAKKDDLDPGKNGAVVTLADGRKVLLDALSDGTVANEKGAELTLNNGTLKYNVNDLPAAAQGFNTVSTPRGRQIQLSLPDGTRAWLNAGSSLHFPTAFSGTDRKVDMTGEVFFEVAQDPAHPFKVTVNEGISVEVLGTAFNINAYTDEPSISTTLAEGSVKMNYKTQSIILKAGQQGIAANAGGLRSSDVDVSEITAWKDGRFELYGNIKDIMRQLQRWYNINEVEYISGTENMMLVATIARSKKLSEVLAILERTGSVHFTILGDKVIVKP